MAKKSTNKELVAELQKRNLTGKYDQLIENAKSNRYHDYKNPDDVICGKMELAADLSSFPELQDISDAVVRGDYDEEADEQDKAMLRSYLPKKSWPVFGL
ncbi:hypothetical protein [Deminuibacter soli]|uniref:Uncharacterized protein n=1 Tax=Deminuibacter soli TaxID=2291815 RepID=A0A3E1NQG0_9BACT|nr:hypothetical protein [Deminuibacter soli]RFM30054.1 hypothetical protein DXN05_03520 [Deminuibacter soli]